MKDDNGVHYGKRSGEKFDLQGNKNAGYLRKEYRVKTT